MIIIRTMLARTQHPEVAKDKAASDAKFNEDNEPLSDPEKRRKYDQMGANWDRAGAPPLAQLHHRHGLDFDGLGMVGPILAELETFRTEVRFLRRR